MKIGKYIEKEKVLLELEENFIHELIKLRKENKVTQKELSEKSKVLRETIARIETSTTSPQVNTLLKLLEPLGYTLTIKKIEK